MQEHPHDPHPPPPRHRPRRAPGRLGPPRPRAGGDLPDAIRIGSTAPGHLKFILFRNLGLLEKEFAAEGIPVELVTFDGGSTASVALGSGQLDLMYTGNNPALRLAASGADVITVGLSSWNPLNETVVIARADDAEHRTPSTTSRATTWPTCPGTVRHSNFSKALETVGLTTNDVESFNFGIETAGPGAGARRRGRHRREPLDGADADRPGASPRWSSTAPSTPTGSAPTRSP